MSLLPTRPILAVLLRLDTRHSSLQKFAQSTAVWLSDARAASWGTRSAPAVDEQHQLFKAEVTLAEGAVPMVDSTPDTNVESINSEKCKTARLSV